MKFSVFYKSRNKYVMINSSNKRIFTMRVKRTRKKVCVTMKDKRKNCLFTLSPVYTTDKPQVQMFVGEERLLTCNCINLFVDRELEFVFMGEKRYGLKFYETGQGKTTAYKLIDRDESVIGEIVVNYNDKGSRRFEIDVVEEHYRDFMVLFPLCLEFSVYKNSMN